MHARSLCSLSLALALCLFGTPTRAQCPEWSTDFSVDGVDDAVHCMTVFQGELVLAGRFDETGSGNARGVARWDGTQFRPFGPGLGFYSNEVPLPNAVFSFDDGSGENLFYADPYLATVNGQNAYGLARWDGSSWHAFSNVTDLEARAFAAFDDGGGLDLYVGGETSTAKGGLYRYENGGLVLVEQCNPAIDDLVVWDDGTGPALYAAGTFQGLFCATSGEGVGRWDGTAWSSVGQGAAGIGAIGKVLAVHDDGSGEQLYLAGQFTSAGGVTTGGLARWDGTSWSDVGGVWNGTITDMVSLDGALYVAAGPAGVSKWDGAAWTLVHLPGGWYPTGLYDTRALAAYDEGNGPQLFVGGFFGSVDGQLVDNVFRSTNGVVSPVGGGEGLNGLVYDLLAWDDWSGPALYAGGSFLTAGPVAASNVARWDGVAWSPLGSGLDLQARALEVFDFGAGPELVVGGAFTSSGGLALNHVARWNGSSWADLGGGMDDTVRALAVFDDGSGERLFAAGLFQAASGAYANRVAVWDGAAWSMPVPANQTVNDMLVWNDGSGPALFFGGVFTKLGNVPAPLVGRWDGTSATSLGPGLSGPGVSRVHALEVFDDGQGEALYVGGDFTQAGGLAVSYIAKWDGTSWSPLGAGVDGPVRDLEAYDDGSGPKLWVGGAFQHAGGLDAMRIATWDGSSWSTPGSADDDVLALEAFAPVAGVWPSMFLGGSFAGGSTPGMHHVAEYSDPCAGSATSYCTAGTSSSGCQALLSASGVASASASSGFVVSAPAVEGSKTGLFFYGTNGKQANPWGNGTSYVCVVPPRLRGDLLDSGGTQGACDGFFGQDLNARWCATCPKPSHQPPAGATMQAQLWYRDPQSTSNQTSSLSDAIEFRIAP